MSDRRRPPEVVAGLCGLCVHRELLRSPRSVFVRCGRAKDDPRFARYPALPVLECPGFEARAAAPGDPDRRA